MITQSLRAEIEQHAIAGYPSEVCGVVIKEGATQAYLACRNAATTKSEHFRIDAQDYATAEDRGEVLAIVHSHPDYSPQPSEADRVACEASGLPWHIVEVRKGDDGIVRTGELISFEPSGYRAPLIGRPFFHGTLDCLQLLVDYYDRELNIKLKHYEREDGWWETGKNYYLDLYEDCNFVKVDELRHGDVIVMQVRAKVPNHAGIYLADGKLNTEPEHYPALGSMLHHLYGRDSRRDIYGGFWAEATRLILRHKDMIK